MLTLEATNKKGEIITLCVKGRNNSKGFNFNELIYCMMPPNTTLNVVGYIGANGNVPICKFDASFLDTIDFNPLDQSSCLDNIFWSLEKKLSNGTTLKKFIPFIYGGVLKACHPIDRFPHSLFINRDLEKEQNYITEQDRIRQAP